jgi:hypothetical protein
MSYFGAKHKKLIVFGKKAAKKGIFGHKNGGRSQHNAGTSHGSPHLMGAVRAAMRKRHGIEK